MNWLKKNKFFVILFIIASCGFTSYKYIYKPHKTIESLTPNFKGSSLFFLQKANKNFNHWNTKIVVLTGKVSSIDKEGITLNDKIYCQFKTPKEATLIKENQVVRIKGRVIGYDNLLDELKLNQCILK